MASRGNCAGDADCSAGAGSRAASLVRGVAREWNAGVETVRQQWRLPACRSFRLGRCPAHPDECGVRRGDPLPGEVPQGHWPCAAIHSTECLITNGSMNGIFPGNAGNMPGASVRHALILGPGAVVAVAAANVRLFLGPGAASLALFGTKSPPAEFGPRRDRDAPDADSRTGAMAASAILLPDSPDDGQGQAATFRFADNAQTAPARQGHGSARRHESRCFLRSLPKIRAVSADMEVNMHSRRGFRPRLAESPLSATFVRFPGPARCPLPLAASITS